MLCNGRSHAVRFERIKPEQHRDLPCNRELRENDWELGKEQELTAQINATAVESLVVVQDLPPVWGKDGGKTSQKRCLAGCIGAKQGDDLTRLNCDRELV